MTPPRDSYDNRHHRDRMRPGWERGRAAVLGGVGIVWGLGLARFLAEVALWPLLYTWPAAASAVAFICAFAVPGVWRLSRRAPRPRAGPRSAYFLPLLLPLPYVVGIASRPLAGGLLLVGGAGLTLVMLWWDRPRWALPALLVLVTLAVYLRTMLPSVGEADTFEFQVVVPQLGVAHPTGYPLYILLGRLFTLLPLRGVAWRLNLASAVFAAGATAVLYDILRRLAGRPLPSFLVALTFAFSPVFWSQAIVAEVYTLHVLLVAAALWLLLLPRWEQQGPEGGQTRRWWVVFFLLGLSLTNHLTTALLVPAAIIALLWDRPRLRPKDWLVGMALFLLGLSLYLFIPLRWPALHDGARMTPSNFLSYVTGGQFHGALRLDGWQDPTRWRIVGRLMLEPFGSIGIALAAVGVLSWAIHRRRALVVTAVTFLAFFVYGLHYYVADIAVFLLPAHLILAIWIGAAVALPARLLSFVSGWAATIKASWSPVLITLLALAPLSQIWTHLPGVDRSADQEAYVWGQYALRQPLARSGAVLADTRKFAPLYYLQQVEGVRPDLDLVLLGTEELYQAELRRRLTEGQTVYLARYLPGLGDLYLRSIGPLAEVGADSPDVRAARDRVLAYLDKGLQLLDAEVEQDPLGRRLYHVTLHWRAESSVDGDFVVRLRLVDADGRVWWTGDGARPVNGLYPTNAWRPKAPISDYHAVPIPDWLPAGKYSLQVGLFSPFLEEGLESDGGSGPWLPLSALDVDVVSEPEPLPRERLVSFSGGGWLVGTDIAEEGVAGTPFTVDLAWHNVAHHERVQLLWDDDSGEQVQAAVFSLPAGAVRSRHTITVPAERGPQTLRVRLVDRLARCGWLAAPKRGCPLAEVRVTVGGEALANFGDRVLLTNAEAGRSEASPGNLIPVTLRWRGLRTMEEDYTVFVQLIGPDGQLHGQVDSWPVQGSYPTSEWRPGRSVSDNYEVRLNSDAPPGSYRVEAGLYQLETMQRLRVLDAEGNAIGDSFLVGTFEVSE